MKVILLFCTFILISIQSAFSQDTLSVDIVNNRFLILDTVLNNSIDAKFVLDTGGDLEVVSSRLFNKLKEVANPVGIFTGFTSTGSRVDLELYRIPSMKVGSLKKNNLKVAPFPELDGYQEFDGILSLKFFENHPFTIDFQSQKIILETPSSLKEIQKTAEVIPIYHHAHTDVTLDIFIPLIINEKVRILAEFDTGTGIEYMMHPYFLNTLAIDTSSVREQDWVISGETQKVYCPIISSIRLDNSELIKGHDLRVTCLEKFIHEGLIGWQLFKNNIVTIDCPDRQMLVR